MLVGASAVNAKQRRIATLLDVYAALCVRLLPRSTPKPHPLSGLRSPKASS
jgi:hypothetical protein